ncbi:MAG: Holliday junction resolvase RuvX [Fuerstiella sp.]|nr:Holliday junction resolvase RuvX [Fuerstiella sp.]MCP4857801.1 Holliday junction resolvase RuvX [Fuerstiella sp.]
MNEPHAADSAERIPPRGRILGIDFGTKRVGVAVSDMFQQIASPLHNYQRNGQQADEHFFRNVAEEYESVGLVVGLPVHMSGDESKKSREARRYGAWLSRVTSLPVEFQDERFSSVKAEALMLQSALTKKQRKSRIDKLAAHILLQAFLDARGQQLSFPHDSGDAKSAEDDDVLDDK